MIYKNIINFIGSFIYPCRMTFPLLGKNDKILKEFLVPVGLFVLVIHCSPLVSAVMLSMLSSIVPCSSSLFGCLSACFALSFLCSSFSQIICRRFASFLLLLEMLDLLRCLWCSVCDLG